MAIIFKHINCVDFMKVQPDLSYSIISSDPPYFKGVAKFGFYGTSTSTIGVKKGNYALPAWDNQIPNYDFFNECKRVGYNQIIWGANYYNFIGEPHKTPRRTELNEWLQEHPTGWIVWDKCNGNTSFNDFELAWTSFNEPTYVFKFLWNGMMQGRSLQEPITQQGNKKLNIKRIHPTQKPVPLYEFSFKKYCSTEWGGRILETHGGSMSAAIAAEKLGIDMTICEIDKQCFDRGIERFVQEML